MAIQANRVSKGIITKIEGDPLTFRLKEDEAAFCSVCCTGETRVLADGAEIRADNLGVGDYIRTECIEGPDGRLLAQRVVLLQPAWMQLSSPEM